MAIENPLTKKVSIPAVLARGALAFSVAVLALVAIVFWQYHEVGKASRNAVIATETSETLLKMYYDLERLTVHDGGEALMQVNKDVQSTGQTLEALAVGGTIRGHVTLSPVSTLTGDRILDQLRGKQDETGNWKPIERDLGTLQAQRGMLLRLGQAYAAVTGPSDGAPFTQARAVGQQVLRDGESVALAEQAAQLEGMAQQLSRDAGFLLVSPSFDKALMERLRAGRLTYDSAKTQLLREPGLRAQTSRQKLGEFGEAARAFEDALESILDNAGSLEEFLSLKESMQKRIERVSQDFASLSVAYSTRAFADWSYVAIFCLAGVALISLIWMGRSIVRETHAQIHDSVQENMRNQEAILLLLNETAQVAEGDLTTRATVSEAITGAIADALNFTLDEMSSVIRGINQAADQVTQETETAQRISEQLFAASQHQSQEIRKTADTVLEVTQSISEVAQSASQSANVAQQSLDAAGKGAEAVRSQIESMSEIRAQIQETAKRIKRLGDSSLEIGEIVGLISDITEQTNVLALNAAIQAAAAGDAGRGFAVVAEEVQRLAERSGEATKQIEAIVKTIQADTQDAVSAMERSTSGVVEGTRLSEEAGQALAEIERISNKLSELIHSISRQTQAQAASVKEMRTGIAGILETTEDTTQGTEQTTVSIGQLAQVAAELRAAVSGFKID